MTTYWKASALCVGLVFSLLCGQLCAAQKSAQAPAAPVPPLILSAKKVFIAYAGSDESLFDVPQYPGGPYRLYNEFYAAIKSWGHYELVGNPGDADVVFEIRFTTYQLSRSEVLKGDNYMCDSLLQLGIRDVKTRQPLWGLTEHIQPAVLQDNRDKNFEKALNAILAELKRIAGPSQSAVESPTTQPS